MKKTFVYAVAFKIPGRQQSNFTWPLLKTHNGVNYAQNWPPHLTNHHHSIPVVIWLSPDTTEHISFHRFASSPLPFPIQVVGHFHHELTFSFLLHHKQQTDKFSNLPYDSTCTLPIRFKYSHPMTTQFASLSSKWQSISILLITKTHHCFKHHIWDNWNISVTIYFLLIIRFILPYHRY